MTKGEIDRLGDKIRIEFETLGEETLLKLQSYRISHKESLAQIFNVLCGINRKMGQRNIVTYRIKRFESIIGKLYRFPQMKFSRMWDIGGCRCIVSSNEEVYRLKKLIEQNQYLEIRKEKDYIKNPQPEGYKSLHLFLALKGDSTVIELQIRNKEDHNWATLVEITDLLFDAKLKEYGKNKELLRFHYLLSKRFELSVSEKKEIATIIRRYKYLEKLSDVFTRNYIDIRKQWINIESKHNHNYFLIETKKDEIPRITSYKSFDEAEENYFQIYKSTQNANIVLTHLPKPNYEQISIAYSNYILTFHSFIEDCYDIFEELIEITLLSKKYFDYIRCFSMYNNLVYNHIKNLVTEMQEITIISRKASKKKNFKLKQKEKDWINDINRQIKKRQDKQRRMQVSLRQNLPNKNWDSFAFKFLTKQILLKYNKKLRRVLSKTE